MKGARLFYVLTLVFWLSAATALASTTSVGGSINRGNSKSMSYALNISQRYEPWVETGIFSLAPLAELGGHAWVPDDSDADTVWGLYFAPGLRFTLFTDAPIQPYVEGSVGAAVNTKDHLDNRKFGSNALFRTRGSVGLGFGDGFRHRVQADYINYSTWGITNTNDGYNTYGVTYGFSF